MAISPIRAIGSSAAHAALDAVERNDPDRHQNDRRRKPAAQGRELVATGVGDSAASAKPACLPPPPPAAFAAQVLGQPGKKRGLRGGVQVLDEARSTYLSREYSGPNDRRPSPGIRKQTDI